MFRAVAIRILFVFLVILWAQASIPENLNGFPYGADIQEVYKTPRFITALSNFDGVHYLKIAWDGYHEFDQAFFPLYPLLLRVVGNILLDNHIFAGIFISIASLSAAVLLLRRILTDHYGKVNAGFFILLLLFYPTSFYTQAIYTEGLFLFLVVACLYFLHKKQPGKAAAIAALSSFSRLQGVFLVFPIFMYFYDHKRSFLKNVWLIVRSKLHYLLACFIGLGLYMMYLHISKGDALYFFTSQPSFGANRSTSLIILPQAYFRYLKIFITAAPNFQYYVAIAEFLFFTASFATTLYVGYRAYLKKNSFEIGLSLFSLSYIVLPTLTGTFSSIPRYTLLALAQYLVFFSVKNNRIRVAILIFFAILQAVLLALFARGYFVG